MISMMADGKEQIRFRRSFDLETLQHFNRQHVDTAIEVVILAEKIKELQKEKKLLELRNKMIIQNVRAGSEEITQECFYTDDSETNERNYYDVSGEIVHSRKLLPSERTMKLKYASNQ